MKNRVLLFLLVFILLVCSVVYLQWGQSTTSTVKLKKEVNSIQTPVTDSVKPGAATNIGHID